MNIISVLYIATRYWSDKDEREKVLREAETYFQAISDEVLCVFDNDITTLDHVDKEDLIIAVPFSGAVQPALIETGKKFQKIIIFAAYMKGTLSNETSDLMIQNNAAPTVMDTYAVLKRDNKFVKLVLSKKELIGFIPVLTAYNRVTKATLLLLGETEPWVVSNERDLSIYENKFGLTCKRISEAEVLQKYHAMPLENKTVQKVKSYFLKKDTVVKEPTSEDVDKAMRLAATIIELLEENHADGVAVACFHLIQEIDTTACLALSYINGATGCVASCEGDMESLISLLMLKEISPSPLWMANPNLQSNKTINFAHCTSCICMNNEPNPYILRSHHESGRGVSIEAELPKNQTVTLLRMGNGGKSVSIQSGMSIPSLREPTCRTQLTIVPARFDYYIESALGCHMIITYGNYTHEIIELSHLLQLEVL